MEVHRYVQGNDGQTTTTVRCGRDCGLGRAPLQLTRESRPAHRFTTSIRTSYAIGSVVRLEHSHRSSNAVVRGSGTCPRAGSFGTHGSAALRGAASWKRTRACARALSPGNSRVEGQIPDGPRANQS